MFTRRIQFPYGKQTQEVILPEEWVGEVVHPQSVRLVAETMTVAATALSEPVGVPPLAEWVQPGQTVAILIDDYTRKTPIYQILPLVLAQLELAGVARKRICLVVALGTHRPMAQDELVAKVGRQVVDRYRIINGFGEGGSETVYVGTSSHGIPAWVQRAVVEADVRIGLGMITPHMDAGFSGGAKIVLPGVCGEETVDAFHAASAFLPVNQLGNVDSPLRRNLEEFVEEHVPLHFIVNLVITLDGQVCQCVAGHPVQAHRVGVEYAKAAFGVPVQRRYPVVVANCYPYDIDLWQSFKGAFCGDLVAEDGGTLIWVTAAPEGNSTYPLVPVYAGRDGGELIREIREGRAEDPKQAVAGVQFTTLKARLNLALVSTGLSHTDARSMGIAYHRSVEEAVTEAVERLTPSERKGSVAVIPQAGIILPLLPSPTESTRESY